VESITGKPAIRNNKKNKSKLAVRFGSTNALIIIIVLTVMSVISIIFVNNLTDSVSRDYVRFYTMDSVHILDTYLNKEISLVQHAAQTVEIIEWFKDEGNPIQKAAAYQKLMFFAGMLQIDGVYFAILNSLNEFEISSGTAYNDFLPFNTLDPDKPYDRWFFDAINSEFDFSLNIDVDKVTDTRRLWINHKVMDNNGEVVGILCSAIQFDDVFDRLFREYDTQSVIGYIVDYNGIIQISSYNPEPHLMHPGAAIEDLEEERSILEASSDPEFLAAVNNFIGNPTIYEGSREPDVIMLSNGSFQYFSIAPIPNTYWLKITFYSSDALLSISSVFLVILVVISAFIIYVISSSLILRRMLFKPLGRLAVSVSEEHDSTKIYGIERDDEIGDLARETKDAWERLSENSLNLLTSVKEREQQAKVLNAINAMATALLSAEDDEVFEASLPEGMKLMAECMDLDRIYIWQSSQTENNHCFILTYEWLEEDGHVGNPVRVGQVFSYSDAPVWMDMFLQDKHVCGPVSSMPEKERAILEHSGVKSVLAVPVHLHGQFWGFVSFDNCRYDCTHTDDDISILRSGSLIIASAINRHIMDLDLKHTAEQAKAASRSKSEFLANMSHEIRTPMNSIIGFSELALDHDIAPKIRDYITNILENSEWLLQIINDILDISKIESGKMELECIPFDLGEMFAACRTLILPSATEKGLILHFYAEPSVGKRLLGDPVKLRQVLVNLLSNAVKFTKHGMIKVQSNVTNVSEYSVTVSFEVKDSGIGISEEQIKRIFDPFTQAETGTTRKYGGSGLGLPITKSIIEMMGGALSVDSTPGIGSKFSFEVTFDATDEDDEGGAAELNLFETIEKPTFNGEILVCEDNLMNQQVIHEHLSRLGLSTVIAENGEVGVEMVRDRLNSGESGAADDASSESGVPKKQFDLILMDIYMPVMDGIEATAGILELDAGIPIIAMTANVMSNERDIYIQAGMADCLGKPFKSQDLWRCLLKHLKPVELRKEDIEEQKRRDNELQQHLINSFVKNNKDKFAEIQNAIESDDIELAHRLTHTLKSNAGQLQKDALQRAAEHVEKGLKDGLLDATPMQIERLSFELDKALMELTPLVNEPALPASPSDYMDTACAQELLKELEPVLMDSDFECISYVGKLRLVQGSENLIRDIESFDFTSALEELKHLQTKSMERG